MQKKGEPWYIHAILYVIIAVLAYVLIKVAIIDPTDFVEKEKYYKSESHARMDNIRQAEILWEKQHQKFSDNLEELLNFVKTDPKVNALIVGVDSLTNRSTNPFKELTTGQFVPDSILFSPKSHTQYILKIDTTTSIDTVINMRGKIVRVDTNTVIGSLYFIECPDGFGTVGDLKSPTLKNTASWE
jgi:hypothetical protein